jgi:peptide-methionine (R)-S-oxide reductase
MEQQLSRRAFLRGAALGATFAATASLWRGGAALAAPAPIIPVIHTQAEWKAILTPAQYDVLREEGTERPFSSPLNDEHRHGIFACVACGLALFSSETKFDSGTGWPSFYQAIAGHIVTKSDASLGMERTEYHCAQCGGHQGHVFNDGPKPTGLRHCNNGVALTFTPTAV